MWTGLVHQTKWIYDLLQLSTDSLLLQVPSTKASFICIYFTVMQVWLRSNVFLIEHYSFLYLHLVN